MLKEKYREKDMVRLREGGFWGGICQKTHLRKEEQKYELGI